MCSATRHVCFVPKADIRKSLDDLVSSQEERLRDSETESFGSLEVDDELKLGRVLHRQVGRLCAAQYAVDILRALLKLIYRIKAI